MVIRKKLKKRKKYVLSAYCVILILLVYIGYTTMSIWNYSQIDEKCICDVVIVLGAGTDGKKVSPVFRERINHGIYLYQNHYAKKIILTGGYAKGNKYSDAYIAKLYATKKGIPQSDILIEEDSTITQENLENAKNIMDYHGYQTALIVSDPLHMKRSMLMAKDLGIKAYSSPTPTSMYSSMKTKMTFLAREEFFYVGYRIYRILT